MIRRRDRCETTVSPEEQTNGKEKESERARRTRWRNAVRECFVLPSSWSENSYATINETPSAAAKSAVRSCSHTPVSLCSRESGKACPHPTRHCTRGVPNTSSRLQDPIDLTSKHTSDWSRYRIDRYAPWDGFPRGWTSREWKRKSIFVNIGRLTKIRAQIFLRKDRLSPRKGFGKTLKANYDIKCFFRLYLLQR